MGLFDRFTGTDRDDTDEDTPDYYRVAVMSDDGGWHAVEGYDEMETPIDRQTFEYNAAPLDPGNYRLFAVVDNLNRTPQSKVGWTLEVEGDDQLDTTTDSESELRRELQALRAEVADDSDDSEDIQEMIEKQKAAVGLQMLQNPEFIKRYGDKLALSIMGVDDGDSGGGVEMEDFETFKDNPISATAYQIASTAADDPEAVEQLSQTMGNTLGSFLGGAATGATGGVQGQQQPPQQQPQPDQDDSPAEADDDTGREVDAGPSDPSELGVSPAESVETDTDELAEIVAQGEQASQQADSDDTGSETVARREGPGTTTTPDSDPMSAGPTVDADGDPGATDPDNGDEEVTTTADAADELDSYVSDDPDSNPDTDEMAADENGHDEDADVQPTDQPQSAADVAEGL
jgi:hypothetical protein